MPALHLRGNTYARSRLNILLRPVLFALFLIFAIGSFPAVTSAVLSAQASISRMDAFSMTWRYYQWYNNRYVLGNQNIWTTQDNWADVRDAAIQSCSLHLATVGRTGTSCTERDAFFYVWKSVFFFQDLDYAEQGAGHPSGSATLAFFENAVPATAWVIYTSWLQHDPGEFAPLLVLVLTLLCVGVAFIFAIAIGNIGQRVPTRPKTRNPETTSQPAPIRSTRPARDTRSPAAKFLISVLFYFPIYTALLGAMIVVVVLLSTALALCLTDAIATDWLRTSVVLISGTGASVAHFRSIATEAEDLYEELRAVPCSGCGEFVRREDSFCPHCGTRAQRSVPDV